MNKHGKESLHRVSIYTGTLRKESNYEESERSPYDGLGNVDTAEYQRSYEGHRGVVHSKKRAEETFTRRIPSSTPVLHHWNCECDNDAPSLAAHMTWNIEDISIAKAGDGLSGHV